MMIPYFGASVYDDPASMRQLAYHVIKNVKTPTLILVAERDGECPLRNRRIWHALKTLGVENEFVVMPTRAPDFEAGEPPRHCAPRDCMVRRASEVKHKVHRTCLHWGKLEPMDSGNAVLPCDLPTKPEAKESRHTAAVKTVDSATSWVGDLDHP